MGVGKARNRVPPKYSRAQRKEASKQARVVQVLVLRHPGTGREASTAPTVPSSWHLIATISSEWWTSAMRKQWEPSSEQSSLQIVTTAVPISMSTDAREVCRFACELCQITYRFCLFACITWHDSAEQLVKIVSSSGIRVWPLWRLSGQAGELQESLLGLLATARYGCLNGSFL